MINGKRCVPRNYFICKNIHSSWRFVKLKVFGTRPFSTTSRARDLWEKIIFIHRLRLSIVNSKLNGTCCAQTFFFASIALAGRVIHSRTYFFSLAARNFYNEPKFARRSSGYLINSHKTLLEISIAFNSLFEWTSISVAVPTNTESWMAFHIRGFVNESVDRVVAFFISIQPGEATLYWQWQ